MVINTVDIENKFENSGLKSQTKEIRQEKTEKNSYPLIPNKLVKYVLKGIMTAIDKIMNI